MSWLEEEPPAPPPRRSVKPSRRPAPNKTIEVKLEWLEPETVPPPAQKRRIGPPPLPQEPPKGIARPRRQFPPPLPREEPEHRTRRPSMRPRKK